MFVAAGILSKVPSLRDLDALSTIAVCSKLKTIYHEKDVYDERAGIDHTYIFRQGEIGYDMTIVMDGMIHLIDGDVDDRYGEGQTIRALRFGDFIDEHMALLPPGGYRRRKSCYASTISVVGLLSAEDIQALREESGEIDSHMRPFVQHAKRARYQKKIDAVFSAMDVKGNGWIDLADFGEVVKRRKSKGQGGTEAEAFFHQILAGAPATDQLIEDTYSEIFLQALDLRQSKAVYQKFQEKSKFNKGYYTGGVLQDLEEGGAEDAAQNTSSAIDKASFEAWWLADQEDDYDKVLEKKRVKARLDHVIERTGSMKAQMDKLEAMARQLK